MNRLKAIPPFLVLTMLVLMLFLSFSFYGLDFGFHWDENYAKFDSVRDSVNAGWFIQGAGGQPSGINYNHGGVNYLLTWFGFAPELCKYFRNGVLTREALSDAISPVVYSLPVRLRVRAIYVVITSLSMVWLLVLTIVLGRSQPEAFLAATIFAGSWEVAYHSRWIAPDAIMMQFVLLSFLCLAIGCTSHRSHWFYLGAISVGLAIGTKYPAGLVMPFFLIGAGQAVWLKSRSAVDVLRSGVGIIATTGATFVITNPGVVIDPFRFFAQVQQLSETYSSGWYGHTVTPGLPHFMGIVEYFALQLFSHYWPVSLTLAVFCLVGFPSIATGERRIIGLLITGFVLAYLAYFSQQSAMIVRNLLVVVPFVAMASARGISLVAERFTPKYKLGLYSMIAVSLIVNFGWEAYAAHQIGQRKNSEYFLTTFEDYAGECSRDTFFVSAKLSSALHGLQGHAVPANISTDPSKKYTKVAFFQSEGPGIFWRTWPANWWSMYEKTFGSLEVNLDAYPSFLGNERILVVTAAHFHELPLNERNMLVITGSPPGFAGSAAAL